MTNPPPITSPELQQMKAFWQEEDERNGGMSDTMRCILEIERLRGLLKDITDETEPCQPYEGGGGYRATKLEKRLAEHFYTRHEIDERFGALLDYLKKSATFIDFDPRTNGNPQRLQLTKELRKRFLP